MIIRKNMKQHMDGLKNWLEETKNTPLEEMSAFFSARIDGYEEHMSIWKNAYRRFAEFLPEGCKQVLDLGCGTGLELDECFLRFPDLQVTGLDLCPDMLEKLLQKHGDKHLEAICADYFLFDMGKTRWDAVISFESLHHFFPEQKQTLYRKIQNSLKEGGTFLLGDYIACCDEEETLLQKAYRAKRERFSIPQEYFVHFDIPLTLEHEMQLLHQAGFSHVFPLDSIEGASMVLAKK